MCFVLAIICLTLCMPMLFSVFFFIILNYKNVSYMDFLFTTIIIFGPALFLCCVWPYCFLFLFFSYYFKNIRKCFDMDFYISIIVRQLFIWRLVSNNNSINVWFQEIRGCVLQYLNDYGRCMDIITRWKAKYCLYIWIISGSKYNIWLSLWVLLHPF